MDVDEMQTKLASWSQDPDFRFDDIYNLLYDWDFLFRAYKNVKSNSGAGTAGVDGQTMKDFKEDRNEHLKDLQKSLRSQSYDPRPVRRTYIPKGDGRKRPLGIPTIKDRIVQETLRMVLEPIYETDFSDNSFGFRPNRRTHDAIKLVRAYINGNKMAWVVDADVKGFFDNVDHGRLGKIIQDRITDRKILKLVWDFLKAGVMEDGTYRHSTTGTPQGGIVSPLLANIYLNELDQWVKKWTGLPRHVKKRRRRKGDGNWNYVRYADDFLLLSNGTKGEAEEKKEEVGNFVAKELNLTLSKEKTNIVHAEDGFEYLGYRFRKKDNSWGVTTWIPKEAKVDVKNKILAATDGETEVSARLKLRRINAVLMGWTDYYKYATHVANDLSSIENFAWQKVTDWLAEKYGCSRGKLPDKVESMNPLKVSGKELVNIGNNSETYTETPMEKEHPYLGNSNPRRTEEIPGENPWLANTEERAGSRDKRQEALERDDWSCQGCGDNLIPENAEVHHKRHYAGYGDKERSNNLSNLISLCTGCHEEKHSNL